MRLCCLKCFMIEVLQAFCKIQGCLVNLRQIPDVTFLPSCQEWNTELQTKITKKTMLRGYLVFQLWRIPIPPEIQPYMSEPQSVGGENLKLFQISWGIRTVNLLNLSMLLSVPAGAAAAEIVNQQPDSRHLFWRAMMQWQTHSCAVTCRCVTLPTCWQWSFWNLRQ